MRKICLRCAPLLLSLVLSLAGCGSNPDGGPDGGRPPPGMPSLHLVAPAVVDSYTCARLTVSTLGTDGQPAAVSASTQVTLSGLGQAQAFATLPDCQGGTATSTIAIAASRSGADFYLRTSVAETLTLKAAAPGYTAGTVAVTTTLFQLLGQPDVKTIPNVELGEFAPAGGAVAGGKLLLAAHNRVIIWKSLPASSSVMPDVVLGQPDKSSVEYNIGGGPTHAATAANMNGAKTVASDGTRVFVSDSYNHRVLVWNSFPTADGQPADFALGQPAGANNLTSNTANNGGVSGSSMSGPWGVFIAGTQLLVADSGNNRVLVWKTLPTSPVAADFALGQPDGAKNLTTNGAGTTAATLRQPRGLWVEGTKLFVADKDNNRVLVWNTLPTGVVSAIFALGQPAGANNLKTGTANNGGLSGGSLNHPDAIASDGTHLYVADTDNNRVLLWKAIPGSVVAADAALGQADLKSSGTGTTATTLGHPNGVFSDKTRLFVADFDNNRTLVWNPAPAANAAPASFALGQPAGSANLTSGVDYDGVVSAASMNYPNALTSDGTRFFVVDYGNHRVLVWNGVPTKDDQPADFALGQAAGNGNLAAYAAPNPPTGSSMWHPNDAALIGTRLFVADSGNNRVLVWNTVPTAPVPADFALGQPAGASNLTANTANNGGVSGASMNFPYALASDGTRLFVTDANNNRVLVWNAIPAAPVPADFALGQPAGAANLTSGMVNNGGVSAASLYNPSLLFTDGKMLTLADGGNNRVLLWHSIPTAAVGADLVLGQPDFTQKNSGATSQTMNFPEHAISDGKRLYVSDSGNNRVLVWDPLPTSNGQAATAVIGQADLTSVAPNRDGGVTGKGLYAPFGLRLDGTRLFIVDSNNHRVVIVPTVGSL